MKDGNPLKWKAVFYLKLQSGTGAGRMLEIVAQDSWDHVRKDYIEEKSKVDGRDYESLTNRPSWFFLYFLFNFF